MDELNTTPPPAPVTQTKADPPPAPVAISLPVEEYQRLMSTERSLAELQKARAAELEAAENERIKLLAEKGEALEAVASKEKQWEAKHAELVSKHTALETSLLNEKKSSVIAEFLVGKDLDGEKAGAKLKRLLDLDYEAVRNSSGAIEVRHKASLRPAADVLREELAAGEYDNFFKATSRGGQGTDGTKTAETKEGVQAGSLEAIAANWKNTQNKYQSFGLYAVNK